MDFNIARAVDILLTKITTWLEELISMLPNLLVAVVVLLFSYLVARIIKRISLKLFNRFSEKEAINNLFATIIYLVVIGMGLVMALNVLHLDRTVSSLLAGAGIIGLALGFAFQDITANFISGILLAFRKPIQIGDIVQVKDYMGEVEKIDLRVTMIKTFQGLHVIIPNKEVLQSPVTNFTKTYERRIDLEVGVSYAEDLERVEKIAIDAVSELPYLLPNQEVKLFYKAFGDSSINFIIQVWIHYPDEPGFLQGRSDVIKAIKAAFDDHGITIPFPIRTLDFGIKGGQTLHQQVTSYNGQN